MLKEKETDFLLFIKKGQSTHCIKKNTNIQNIPVLANSWRIVSRKVTRSKIHIKQAYEWQIKIQRSKNCLNKLFWCNITFTSIHHIHNIQVVFIFLLNKLAN